MTRSRPGRALPVAVPTRPWLRVAPAVFLLAWGGNHFTPLLHLYEQLGHYSTTQADLLLGMYVFGLIPGLLVAAAISDFHGRRPVLLGGLAAGLAGSALLACGLHSFALLCAGRALAGIGVGVAMSVGSSWIKELSGAPYDPWAGGGAAARRPALTMTLGFGIGAAVTGVLAQWGPAPAELPYGVHLLFGLAVLPALLSAPETLPAERRASGSWWRDLRVPAAGHRRFRSVVIPAAPWVFGAAAVAYAVMPAVSAPRLGQWTTLYATAACVITLGAGAVAQLFVDRIDAATGGRALQVGMAVMTAGMALAVIAALSAAPALGLAVGVVLGTGYGITVVAGLAQVQAIASPRDLAGLTGVYYSLSYTGFLLPTLLSMLLPYSSYASSLIVVTVACGVCLAAVTVGLRRLSGPVEAGVSGTPTGR
jgi:hypothetical protein